MITIVSDIVGSMDANGDTFKFAHGEADFNNLQADEEQFPAVYLDEPLTFTLPIPKSGYIGEIYILRLLFLYKSQLDWTPEQHNVNAIVPATQAARQFISMLQKSIFIDEVFNDPASAVAFINLFDVNVSGITLTIKVKKNVVKSVCAPTV